MSPYTNVYTVKTKHTKYTQKNTNDSTSMKLYTEVISYYNNTAIYDKIAAEKRRSWRRRTVRMADAEMSATRSTSDEKRPKRRRKTTRCCGLYSPMTPRGTGEHRALAADKVDEQASAMAMVVRESRGMVHAFATSTKIHGMKNIYRAQGE